MNKYTIFLLKALRKFYFKFVTSTQNFPKCENNPDVVSSTIIAALTDTNPCMIARFGSTEMTCLDNYMGIKYHSNEYLNFITGKTDPWWWENKIILQMQQWSGFFPPNIDKVEQFCKLMLEDMKQVDILGSWLASENRYTNFLGAHCKIHFELMNPYFSKIPWTIALEGKKVLVVHPFASTIEQQYKKRELLFENNLLPDFDLKTVKAIQSIAGEKTNFPDWFSALDSMKKDIDNIDYDICLIGCGAYGFPLAAHVKRQGKKAIHLGGSLQLLFGIRGKRWEVESYNQEFNYAKLINDHWVRPNDNEKPSGAEKVEDSCYW